MEWKESIQCYKSIILCFLLSVTYLLSLHIWKNPHGRDHPSTIKKRFISAFIMLFISPCFLYIGLDQEMLQKHTFIEILGLRTQGLCQAIFMPLFLTMILFLGPISMELYSGLSKVYIEEMYWFSNLKNLIWLRNHIVAPFTEEFTFRSCIVPMLLNCFTPLTSVLSSPLFFGVAHFHHMWERIHHMGMAFDLALKISCFQFIYTTIFGMYSAYIFYRTGHFVSVFIVHAFCNHMGFPDFTEVITYKGVKKFVIVALFLIGFCSWCFLLKPLTEPAWYHHTLLK